MKIEKAIKCRQPQCNSRILMSAVIAVAVCAAILVTANLNAVFAAGRGTIKPVTPARRHAVGPAAGVEPSDAVKVWNLEAARLTTLPASALAPIQQGRMMAIFQVAVHDAVNGITRQYEPYLPPLSAPIGAATEAAAIAAAHRVLVTYFPAETESLNALFDQTLAAHGLLNTDPGIAYGVNAANEVIALRASDIAAQAQFDYKVPGAGFPGVWIRINNAPALLPGWGAVTPFVLYSSAQFRPGPPPDLSSEQYARDYNEIKLIGKSDSATRTVEQTQIAQFWRGSPVAIWNPVLAQVAATRNLSISEIAHHYALVYIAASDSGVACWEAKYHFNYWRPQLAIVGGAADQNPDTIEDPTWTPLLPTPPHPEYPSGHSSNSSSIGSMMGLLFGNDPGVRISVTLSNITREWDTFDQAVAEVIEARIYSGIHFRTADEEGAKMGRRISAYIHSNALRPCSKGRRRCNRKGL